jgi:ABC-type antimicrobial peptide transport system permease subunit
MALGATARNVRGLVLQEALVLAFGGVLVGLLLASVATRTLRGLLYDTSAVDPASLLAASLLLVGAALAASWLPARRAARVDPMVVLRAE